MREVKMVLSIMLPANNDEPESVIRSRIKRSVLPLIGNPCRIEELPKPAPCEECDRRNREFRAQADSMGEDYG